MHELSQMDKRSLSRLSTTTKNVIYHQYQHILFLNAVKSLFQNEKKEKT